jgi:DNA-binding MarR family transcriptional regulator
MLATPYAGQLQNTTIALQFAEEASVDPATMDRLHSLVMDFVRVVGLLQLNHADPAVPLSLSQAFALHELDTPEPLAQRDLAERLGLEKSTVSRLVADMEQKELVVRERDPANRRLYRLRLTDKGRRLHATAASGAHQRFVQWFAAMPSDARDALLTGLPALIEAARASDHRRPEPR